MAFQIKDFASVLASMINHVRGVSNRLTDFNVGSVIRTMLEAPAVEIDELYQQMLHGLNEAIPAAIYKSFGFPRIPAATASGSVTFSTSSAPPITIPAGTQLSTAAGVIYTTVSVATIGVGETTVDAQVVAESPGLVGNTGSGTITQLVSPVSGVDSVTNASALSNGRDLESEESRKVRFNTFIDTIARGTVDAIAFGARSANLTDSFGNITEFVVDAVVDEPFLTDSGQPVGYAKCYIWNGATGASSGLIARAQQIIDGYTDSGGTKVPGWKAAGVVVDVLAVTPQSVNVTATVTLESGTSLSTDAQTKVSDYLTNLPIGRSALLSEIIALIQDTDEVYNVAVTAPPADVTALINEKNMPGTISITVA